VVYLSAEMIAGRFFHQPALTPLVQASAPLVLFTIVGVVVAACLSGLEFFRPVALANALGAALLLVCVVPAARVLGLGGVVGALGAQALCIAAVAAVALARASRALGVPISVRVPPAELRPMVRFILPAMLSIVVYTPVTWYGTVILARTPGGVAQLGIFGAAQHWFAAIAFIPTALSPVVLSLLASDAPGAHARQSSVLRGSLLVNGAIATVIGAAAALFARPLLALYGAEFVAAVPALRLLALSAVIGSLLVAVGQLIVARGSMWWGFALNLLWGVTFVTVALRAVPGLGATGLAIAYLSSYAVHLLSCALYVTLGHRRGPRAAPDAIPVAPGTLP
jgi:O-antigen/teichoic acid export membrane protein